MRILSILVLMLLYACALAQQSPRAGQWVRSPEVLPDGRVIFRCKVPNAKEVKLQGEALPSLAMVKDDAGIWSVTTSPLAPDYYCYSFLIDRVAYSDPANPDIKTVATGGAESIVHVPGPSSLSWEPGNVPHGKLIRHQYRSDILGEIRDFYAYTPPGYDGRKAYPVLYLLHGVMETETAWESVGKASVILDNMIAWKKAVPMIVVMPSGYGFSGVADHMGQQFGGVLMQHKLMDTFSEVLLKEIEPIVIGSYRTTKSRAIAGCSMGGVQALYIGINHSDKFGWIGAFSPAVIIYGAKFDDWFPHLADRHGQQIDAYCGKSDFLIGFYRTLNKWFAAQNVQVNAKESEGSHTWNVWRRNLEEFSGVVFK